MGGGADYPCSAETSAVQHFVLVHGAGHGGWCWYKIKCLLENTGHTVTCPDLSSCGVDPCSVDSISTFQEYNKPLDDILSAVPEGKKIILVGHSAGGQNITEVIHKFPNKIKVAVFVGACMLRNGFLTQEDIKVGAPDLSRYGDIYDYGYGKGRENPPTNVVLKKEVQREILYQMSPLEDCSLAAMLLRPSPLGILGPKYPDDGKDIDRVPRVYIRTLHDNVLLQDQQDGMIKKWPPSDVYAVDSDHCPFFSNPIHLFGLLHMVATNFGHP